MSGIPSMLQYIMEKQGRRHLTQEEEALLMAAQGGQQQSAMPMMPATQQMGFSQPQQPDPQSQPMPQQQPTMLAAANPEDLIDPNSAAGQMATRRRMADQAGQGILPNDVLPTAAPQGNAPARTSVRGKQSSSQEDQLVRMLMGRGMSEREARERARQF